MILTNYLRGPGIIPDPQTRPSSLSLKPAPQTKPSKTGILKGPALTTDPQLVRQTLKNFDYPTMIACFATALAPNQYPLLKMPL